MERSFLLLMLEEYKRVVTTSLTKNSTPYNCSETERKISSRRMNDFERTVVTRYLNIWMRKLSSCDCEDPYLTAVFINLYIVFQKDCLTTLKDVITNLLLLNKDLTDVREGVNYGLLNVLGLVQRQDWDFLKVLILYGIIRPKETLTSSVKESHDMMLRDFFKQIVRRAEERLMCFKDFTGNILLNMDRRDFSSIYADSKAQTLREYNVVKSLVCQDYVWGTYPAATVRKCVDSYFQVIPDPFVTAREIEDVIEIPQASQFIFHRECLSRFLTEYRRLFPESNVLRPRSLKHLSRCAARDHLCKYGLLPNVVSRLMIPKAIKDYLLVVNPKS